MCVSFMAHIYFHIEDGFHQQDRRKWPYFLLAFLVVCGVFYGTILLLAPKLPVFGSSIDTTEKRYQQDKQDYIKINRIGLITTLNRDSNPVLGSNAWLKSSDLPSSGNTLEIVAKGFQLSVTPQDTKQKSPFHLLGKLREGDAVEVSIDGVVYGYRVNSVKQASPTDQDKQKNKLLLYTAKADGQSDGGSLVIAEAINPVGDDSTNSKTPVL
jgi:hypothetical protein